jgi:DNA-binding NarL/FixJ family response regulator
MGVPESASRVPLVLVLAAEAARSELWVESTRVTHFTQGPEHYQLVSCARPDAELSRVLAPAACAVTRLLVEGKCHAEIAAARNTSSRTVANQLAAAFTRLQVSGRAELLYRLASGGTFAAGASAVRIERHAS